MADVFVVSLLHFNLQYCAGGYEGLFEDWPSSNDDIEDQIIVESFEPVLDLLLAHPTWGMDIELQGYMIEVLAERHPAVLAKLETLDDRDQIDIVSFHWSDQLWVAYPPLDQERSLALVADVFAEHGLALSETVFTQEGQFGEGMLRKMPEHGYRVAILPHNLGEYVWGYEPDATLYEYGDVVVIPGGSSLRSADGTYEVQWAFFDDGELLATGDVTPYLGPSFVHDPDAVEAFEADLAAREAAGAKISTIADYVAAVESRGTAPLPPVLDGTWQPAETGNLLLWMGGSGLWGRDERDNEIRTRVMQARHAVAAAEAMAEGDPGLSALVEQAWREVLLAEVSDATGWNPYTSEPQYARDHADAAIAIAQGIAEAGCVAQDKYTVVVDIETGGVAWGYTQGSLETTPLGMEDARLAATFPGRAGNADWSIVDGIDDVLHLDVTFPIGEDPPALSLPWDALVYATTPAMLDEVVTIAAEDVAAEDVGLALPNGLVRLHDGVWLVKRTDTVHLAGVFSRSGGTLTFTDHTVPVTEEAVWQFLVVLGDESRALEVANDANVHPWVTFYCELPEGEASGCGCATSGAGSWAWLAALPWLWRRRCSR